MLKCQTQTPNVALAEYVNQFLTDAPWLRRRVEKVAFVDVDTILRRTTLDIGMSEIRKYAQVCPIYKSRPIVPLSLALPLHGSISNWPDFVNPMA
jgi:hypothetical protein